MLLFTVGFITLVSVTLYGVANSIIKGHKVWLDGKKILIHIGTAYIMMVIVNAVSNVFVLDTFYYYTVLSIVTIINVANIHAGMLNKQSFNKVIDYSISVVLFITGLVIMRGEYVGIIDNTITGVSFVITIIIGTLVCLYGVYNVRFGGIIIRYVTESLSVRV